MAGAGGDRFSRVPLAEPGMRIGLFGGSFNPPHEGHRLVALECLKRLRLDRVWVLISPGNPLKDRSILATVEERAAETQAVMSHPALDVSTFETERGFRYTYETVSFLTGSYPAVRFVWIMGADSLFSFDRWERWDEIARAVPMAIYARPGAALTATASPAAVALEQFRVPEDEAEVLADREPPSWVYLHGIMSAQSSTAIRTRTRVVE
jgi:nicotinate-nucleotide adenylyltransferase